MTRLLASTIVSERSIVSMREYTYAENAAYNRQESGKFRHLILIIVDEYAVEMGEQV